MDVIIYSLLICCLIASLLNVAAANILGPSVRLRNGSSIVEGRVEVYYHGEWGTLCRNHFGIDEAYVVCRQLGFFSVKSTVNPRVFGAGHGPIHLNELKCTGLEEDVFDCGYTNISNTECTHEQDAGVRCIKEKETGILGSNYKPIRLVDGGSLYEGRIEILHYGQWSTICDDKWDIKDARVACRQLGYTSALISVSRARFGPGKGMILFDDTACTGYEKYLNDCRHAEYGAHDCSHGEDAGVVCDHLTKEPPPADDYDLDIVDWTQPLISSLGLYDSSIYSYDFESDTQIESKPCMTDKCQNDATCVAFQNSSYICICKYPWSGKVCDIAGPSIFHPPYRTTKNDDVNKWTDLFKDVNTYIVFGGFSFVLILSVLIVYAINDIREKIREHKEKPPTYV